MRCCIGDYVMNEPTFAEIIANKLGITPNFNKLYRHIAEELAIQYGYDEDAEDEDGWGVEYLTLTLVRDGVVDIDVAHCFEQQQIDFLSKNIKDLSISVRKEGRSHTQEWEFYFPLNLQSDSNPFMVSCFFLFDVTSGVIKDNGSSVASETHSAEEVEKMKLFFQLKN